MRMKITFAVAFVLLVISAGQVMGQAIKDDISGFSTLIITPSARHAGMGGGYGSTAGDLFSLHSNPAGILNIPYFTVGAAHNQWIADYRSEFVGLVYRPGDFALGVSIDYGTVGDIEKRSGPSDDPEGYFDLNDLVAGVTLAHFLGENLQFGLTSKIVYEKIDVYSSTGIAFDFGIQFRAMTELVLGAGISNLGTKMKLDEDEYDLPRILRAGASYYFRDFMISADVFYPTDDDPHFHVGGEYGFNKMLFLRSGFQSGYDDKALSFGLGIEQKRFNIDYAYVPFNSDLGDTHRISFTYSLLKED